MLLSNAVKFWTTRRLFMLYEKATNSVTQERDLPPAVPNKGLFTLYCYINPNPLLQTLLREEKVNSTWLTGSRNLVWNRHLTPLAGKRREAYSFPESLKNKGWNLTPTAQQFCSHLFMPRLLVDKRNWCGVCGSPTRAYSGEDSLKSAELVLEQAES